MFTRNSIPRWVVPEMGRNLLVGNVNIAYLFLVNYVEATYGVTAGALWQGLSAS